MHLEKLEINGFKSFRDKTVVTFAPGITAIVGRNGHGKSNLVDAIRWALGAGSRATKDLRIKKTQDVIFAGTYDDKGNEISPPKDTAEVAVTFSNEDKVIDVDAPVVEIRRIVDRSGISEYYVNRMRVKAEEIRSLLYDTGIGKAGYSILEQGKIAKLLSDKPEERRSVFEEAAGISGYKNEMDEANRRVSDTDENIKAVLTDFTRLKNRNEKLRIQKDNLLKYKKLKDSAFEYNVKLRLVELRDAEKNKGAFEERINKERETLKNLKEKINQWQKENQDRNSSLSELYAKKDSVTTEINNAETDKALTVQSISNEDVRFNEEQKRLAALKNAQGELSDKVKEKNDLLKLANIKKSELIKTEEKTAKAIEKLNASLLSCQEESKKLAKNALEKDAYLKNLRSELELKIEQTITSLYDSLVDIENGDNKAIATGQSLIKKLEDFFNEYKKAQPVYVDELLRTKQKEIDEKTNSLMASLSDSNKSLSNTQMEINTIASEINGIVEVLQSLKKEQDNNLLLITECKDSISKITSNKKVLQDKVKELEKLIAEKRKIQNELGAKIAKISSTDTTKIDEYNNKITALEVSTATLTGRLDATKEQIEKIQSSFFDEYGRSIAEMQKEIKLSDSETSEEIRRNVNRLNSDIRECGNINEYAEDEWKDNNEQYLLVKAQLEDLERAKSDSKKVYDELKTRSAEQFVDTFERIKKSFDDTFKIMFGGGNGSIELHTEQGGECDPLTCGIDIKVQPPGKTMRLLGLSGGEADKVAAVLLFSIYRIKSTPFCILDEIDHAWDSHNISSFLEMLRHFTDDTQFLIVTHSTQTARGVDRLLAITQVEDGISCTLDYTMNKDAVSEVLTSKGKGIRLKG